MNTTKLNKNTEKARRWIDSYFKSHYFGIEQFYKNPSCNKVRAERDCINRMLSINGTGYKVLGGNSSFFTCGYMDKVQNTLYIETACNTFEIALTD